jgi:ectoine hydroxylase-related dioxygenase (phytanoyl-CoA dioxygenase family)
MREDGMAAALFTAEVPAGVVAWVIELDRYRAHAFGQNGVAGFRGLIPASIVAGIAQEVDDIVADARLTDRYNLRSGLSWRRLERRPERIDPIIDIGLRCAALARDARLVQTVASAMGEPVQLVHDKLILKSPGMQGYDLHQDAAWWQGLLPAQASAATLAVAIDGSDTANGGLRLYPRFHNELLSPAGEERDLRAGEVAVLDKATPWLPAMAPGDAILFDSRIPHGSGPNESSKPRRTLYFVFATKSDSTTYGHFRAKLQERALAAIPEETRAQYYFR